MHHGSFVFTSNVDGQFQKAGFSVDRILECHGSIHHLQCTSRCSSYWSADQEIIEVDEARMRAVSTLPLCPKCGSLARPNILMFGDWGWDAERESEQSRAFRYWMSNVQSRNTVLIECGAGSSVPTVRITMERLADQLNAKLIRINTREPDVPSGHIGIAEGALEALTKMDAML